MTSRRFLKAVAALAVLWLALAVPDTPSRIRIAQFATAPWELLVVVPLLLWLRAHGSLTLLLRALIVSVIALVILLKLADIASLTAFGRPFNPAVDMNLVKAGWDLALGSLGALRTAAALAGGLAASLLLLWALWWSTGVLVTLPRPCSRRALAVVAVAGLAVLAGRVAAPPTQRLPGQASSVESGIDHFVAYHRTQRDLARFRRAAERDDIAARAGALGRLAGHDVLIVFIESYGRTSFDTPLYASAHVPTLRRAEERIADAGLAMRSAWLTSPVIGGQSWLAHATLTSGLRIDNQIRYRALLASPRQTLYRIARTEGFETSAVVPAITMAWPEARDLGFETVRAASDLGYAGAPFNWITMPDQFTLAVLERMLAHPRTRPLFAEVALISSHAPWVPIPPLIPWAQVGDGTVFNRWADSGDPPDVVWRDDDRIRAQYRKAIDYTLRAVTEFAVRQGPDAPLMLVLGDHQPAPFVALGENRDVPVHLIGPPDLVAAAAGWDWSSGLIPSPSAPVWPMEALRDRFLAAFRAAGQP